MSNTGFLKPNSHLPKKCIICFNYSPSKMMENAFCFILKALFVLEIFKFLPQLFGHVEKTAWLERKVNFENDNVIALITKNYDTRIAQHLIN